MRGMSRPIARITPLLRRFAAGLLLAPWFMAPPAGAESAITTTATRVGAAIQFRVIIPAVLRVAQNDHPAALTATGGAPTEPLQATQRLVVQSNMRHGFCMNLQLANTDVAQWRVQLAGAEDAQLTPTAEGYRLCVNRRGLHELTLQHAFTLRPASATPQTVAHAWPVQVQLVAL